MKRSTIYMLFMLLVLSAAGCAPAAGDNPGPVRGEPVIAVQTSTDRDPQTGQATAEEAVVPVLVWEMTVTVENGPTECHHLVIAGDHRAQYGVCNATPTSTVIRAPQWDEIVQQFAPFAFESQSARMIFYGQGSRSGAAWQRALMNWAEGSYGELSSGRACSSCQTVLAWSAGEVKDKPGMEAKIVITNYGYAYYYLVPIKGGETQLAGRGWLETAEWTKLDNWIQNRSTVERGENGSNYMLGQGKQAMSDAELAELVRWVQSISSRIK